MSRRSVARVIAIVLAGGTAMGVGIANSEAQDVARYRRLSHDALPATVTKSREDGVGMSVFVFILATGGGVFFIEGMTSVLLWVFDEIVPERVVSVAPEHDGPPG